MPRRFSVQRGPVHVIFGAGSAEHLSEPIDALGCKRVVVVCTPRRNADAKILAEQLGARSGGRVAIAREHVPVEVVREARAEIERSQADAILAFGGGSAIGLAKAVAVIMGHRVIAVPTTYSGSEMTPVFGVTDGGEKKTARDERARPTLVIYDPNLTTDLPADVTVGSAWNAMAHAVEALWAEGADRATMLSAEEALRLLSSALVRLREKPADHEAREMALEGAFLAGSVFGDVGGGLHHKLCHILGGRFQLPHAATHAALLPHVVELFSDSAPEAMRAIARALGAVDAVRAMKDLAIATGAPRSLAALGMPEGAQDRVIDAVLAAPPYAPRPLDRESLGRVLARAMIEDPRAEAAYTSAVVPVRAPKETVGAPGFGSTHESEALPGALPKTQNTPRPSPYGLYPDLFSGTPFTTRSSQNSRLWLYRIRPSFSHSVLRKIAAPKFSAPLSDVEPNRTRWKPLPIPHPAKRTDFLDGMVTLGASGDPTSGPGFAVHLYAANADMRDRSFSNADGDMLLVPQEGSLDVRTELGFLVVPPGSFAILPRGLKFTVGVPTGEARGWLCEAFGPRFRLPERGPIGSNGLADARHFRAPIASYEDRVCPAGFETVHKVGGAIYTATQEHSPFDVVAWHGNHVPYVYDLSMFSPMGTTAFDHPDPSIHTVVTAPLDDHGRAVVDFVVFRGRWDVAEHSFRPPTMHRNAASEINGVVRAVDGGGGYVPGCTFLSPLLTAHGISTESYDRVLAIPDDKIDPPSRLSDDSLWIMFESALTFRTTAWARETNLVDRDFLAMFDGMRKRFDPSKK